VRVDIIRGLVFEPFPGVLEIVVIEIHAAVFEFLLDVVNDVVLVPVEPIGGALKFSDKVVDAPGILGDIVHAIRVVPCRNAIPEIMSDPRFLSMI
jgi:hypothetical protein